MNVKAKNLDKKFGKLHAVDDVSFELQPGKVTGYLGPNGSGKSTTMKLMVGLENGTGVTLYDDKPFHDIKNTAKVIGVHFGSPSFYPNLNALQHLHLLAIAKGVDRKRVDEVIDMVGLSSAIKKKPKQFSLGMVQRLGLASALLSKPEMLMLDEPANGLDPQSIHWLRDFLKDYAKEGKIVFVSSHLLSEMELLADDIVIIAAGKIKASGPMQNFIDKNSQKRVVVDSPDRQALKNALKLAGYRVAIKDDGFYVDNVDALDIGSLCADKKIVLKHLEQSKDSLEDVFLTLTSDDQQYTAKGKSK